MNNEAYWKGYESLENGEPCPYEEDTTEYYDWIIGYNFASGSPSRYSEEARLLPREDEDDE